MDKLTDMSDVSGVSKKVDIFTLHLDISEKIRVKLSSISP
jgi:hypothetical protein